MESELRDRSIAALMVADSQGRDAERPGLKQKERRQILSVALSLFTHQNTISATRGKRIDKRDVIRPINNAIRPVTIRTRTSTT